MAHSNCETIALIPFCSARGAHMRAWILCVPSPFVDTDKATQTNFGHKAFFLLEIRLAIAVITGRLLNPLGLQPIARNLNSGLVSLLLAPMSEPK
jgi:hypothetical protein